MKMKFAMSAAAFVAVFVSCAGAIPLPEHPRPDWERAEWVNLNGEWDFAFEARISAEVAAASKDGKMTIRLAAEKTGLAVYGPRFGRMPFGPHLAE